MNRHINLPENLRLVPNPLILRAKRSSMLDIEAEEAQRTGLQPSARLYDFPNEILEAIFVAAAANTRTKSSGGALMRVSSWVQAWVAPHLYHRVVIRNEFAAYSFIQAMASERLPLLRTFVHTLVISRTRYTWYHVNAVEQDATCEAKFEAEGYYPDGPYASQIFKILQCFNDPTCRQSWQNLLVNQGLLPNMETTTCPLPPQLTITGVGEIYWAYLDFSNVRRLRFPDYMTPFNRARHMWAQFPSLTHLGMVIYTDPPVARRVVEVLLQSRTLERLAVVILPLPSAPSNAARSMGNAIYRDLLEVDDERLVVLEEEISILKMLRQPDGLPFWRMVDRVADHVKENGKNKSYYVP